VTNRMNYVSLGLFISQHLYSNLLKQSACKR